MAAELRRLLGWLRWIRRDVERQERELEATRAEFDEKIEGLRQQQERNEKRVSFAELQLRAIRERERQQPSGE